MRSLLHPLLILLIFSSSVVANERPSPIGHVVALSGTAFVMRNTEPHPIQKRLRLFKSDRLVTGKEARLQFRLVDGSVITLGEHTEFDLTQYQFGKNARKHNSKHNSAQFKLIKGVFRFITGKITQQEEPDLQVLTPVATIGIRGTDFWGGYLEPDAVDVLLIESSHKLLISNEQGSVTLDKAGLGTTIRLNEAPIKPRTWPEAKVKRAIATITLE